MRKEISQTRPARSLGRAPSLGRDFFCIEALNFLSLALDRLRWVLANGIMYEVFSFVQSIIFER